MLQLEVVDRMIAEPSTRAYGRLSIMTQLLCEAEKLFESRRCFQPRPKFKAIIRLAPRTQKLAFDRACRDTLIKAFSARRKTVRNALKNLLQRMSSQHWVLIPACARRI